jgi:hypothetical protein
MRRATSDRYTLRDGFKDFVLDKAELKRELEEYITAPHFSLDLRWQMFLDAPIDLSNHETSIYHGLDFINQGDENSEPWHRVRYAERGWIIELVDLISDLESKNSSYLKWPCFKEEGFVNKVKEQLLKDNIKSFTYDW